MAFNPSQHEGHDVRVKKNGQRWCRTCWYDARWGSLPPPPVDREQVRAEMEAFLRALAEEETRPHCGTCFGSLDYPGDLTCIRCRVSQLSRGMLSVEDEQQLVQAMRLKADRKAHGASL